MRHRKDSVTKGYNKQRMNNIELPMSHIAMKTAFLMPLNPAIEPFCQGLLSSECLRFCMREVMRRGTEEAEGPAQKTRTPDRGWAPLLGTACKPAVHGLTSACHIEGTTGPC